ncbi:MAG: hypothetical protein ABJD13_15220 [Paracoccaceae bacterium]
MAYPRKNNKSPRIIPLGDPEITPAVKAAEIVHLASTNISSTAADDLGDRSQQDTDDTELVDFATRGLRALAKKGGYAAISQIFKNVDDEKAEATLNKFLDGLTSEASTDENNDDNSCEVVEVDFGSDKNSS